MTEPLKEGPIGEGELSSIMDSVAPAIINLSDIRMMARAILEKYEVRPKPDEMS